MIRSRHAECSWTRVKVGRKLVGNFLKAITLSANTVKYLFLENSYHSQHLTVGIHCQVFKGNATVGD